MSGPFLAQSGLTEKWWLVTKYRLGRHGNRIAITKYDMDEAIHAIQADAWDEGYKSGRSRAMRQMSDEPDVKPGKNPYRKDTDA